MRLTRCSKLLPKLPLARLLPGGRSVTGSTTIGGIGLAAIGVSAIGLVSGITLLPKPALAIPQTPLETLPSSRLIDYEPLQQLLRQGQWEAANEMTSNLMLQAADQLDQGYLVARDIRLFPCQDLLTVDKLWRYYSNDRFGFSVQAGIWMRMYGKNYKDSQRFEGKVGWHRQILNADLRAQRGHLPLRPASNGGAMDAWGGGWIAEMPKRLSICLNPAKAQPQRAQPSKPKPTKPKPTKLKLSPPSTSSRSGSTNLT
ncbi:GUN4 domain-containing protein [Alkalinema sp. FACHB-956]|uniref:GUN4 domain-containing protein n=1 Tax=Alkalinema sp. FACHB-956 TaxID=2692768 RepID=UPI00168A1BA7|nr:GUN4 domain-containing protein [Alkalinema sp. FACHB-956]MBD2328623.1 GUN4 domain-containing protein [Alkalinema sp. FACHB-956]